MSKVKFIKMRPDAQLPTYGSDGAAGMDLYINEPDGYVVLEPNKRMLVSTGLKVQISPGFEGQVRSRSGFASKQGIIVLNAPGTIDCDYTGELKVILFNTDDQPHMIENGTRVAQMVIAPYSKADIVEVESFERTARGEDGFGSTGEK